MSLFFAYTLAASVILWVSVSGICESPWMKYDTYCYFFYNVTSTLGGHSQEDSSSICKSYGGDLASIADKQESDFISQIFDDESVKKNQRFWIGLNDFHVEGEFMWSDGTVYDQSRFQNWRKDENRHDRDCVSVSMDGTWVDEKCSLLLGFICKRKLDAVIPYIAPKVPLTGKVTTRLIPTTAETEVIFPTTLAEESKVIVPTTTAAEDSDVIFPTTPVADGEATHPVTTASSKELSKCWKEYNEATAHPRRIGQMIPSCKDDGTYKAMQCHGSTGDCWCVDTRTGAELLDSRKKAGEGQPSCEAYPITTASAKETPFSTTSKEKLPVTEASKETYPITTASTKGVLPATSKSEGVLPATLKSEEMLPVTEASKASRPSTAPSTGLPNSLKIAIILISVILILVILVSAIVIYKKKRRRLSPHAHISAQQLKIMDDQDDDVDSGSAHFL